MQSSIKLDFNAIKSQTSILQEAMRFINSNEIHRNGSTGKYWTRCWLHGAGSEKTPSMVINTDTNTYHCFACGETGTVLDIRIHFAGLNPSSGVSVVKAAKMILEDAGNKVDMPAEFQKFKKTTTSNNPVKHFYRASAESIKNSQARLQNSPSSEAYELACRRGWMCKENPYPLGIGKSYGPAANELVLEFPKYIYTRQTAIAFGLENEWEKWNGRMPYDLKKRLTPTAEKLWNQAIEDKKVSPHIKKAPRWSAVPEYHTWVPWEFDARSSQTADTLFITEGPGDGLRLENELIRFGLEYNFHVTSIDSTSCIKHQNFVRICKEGQMTSFFDGFKEICIFLDKDAAGDGARLDLIELFAEIKPQGKIKFITLPEIGRQVQDLSDYFDNEGFVMDLLDLIERTDTI